MNKPVNPRATSDIVTYGQASVEPVGVNWGQLMVDIDFTYKTFNLGDYERMAIIDHVEMLKNHRKTVERIFDVVRHAGIQHPRFNQVFSDWLDDPTAVQLDPASQAISPEIFFIAFVDDLQIPVGIGYLTHTTEELIQFVTRIRDEACAAAKDAMLYVEQWDSVDFGDNKSVDQRRLEKDLMLLSVFLVNDDPERFYDFAFAAGVHLLEWH